MGSRLIMIMAFVIVMACAGLAQEEKAAPKPAAQPEFKVPEDMELIKDIAYSPDGNVKHKLDILRLKDAAKDPMPVIVWIHGGGFVGGSKTSGYTKLERYVKRGYLGVTIDYRFAYEKPFPGQLEDCKCAIRFLRAHAKDYNLDPDHIGVWGGSAGGNLVAMLGVTGGLKEFEGKGGWQDQSSRVQAVVDYFGMTDFLTIYELAKAGKSTERFLPLDGKESISHLLGVAKYFEHPDLCRQASPTTYASKDDPPFYIFHGDLDPLTNYSQGELLNERLRKADVESDFYLVKGGKHGWPARADVDDKVDAFFDKHLKGVK
jgi:acetyl esterase/lipase